MMLHECVHMHEFIHKGMHKGILEWIVYVDESVSDIPGTISPLSPALLSFL